MKKIENRRAKRLRFMELRANGETIKAASASVGISERLGKTWSKDIELETASAVNSRESEIIAKYGLRRRERIERLAKATEAVINAAERIDLNALAINSPVKLLELYLKFNEALANEESTGQSIQIDLQSAQGVLNGLESLYNRVQRGEVSKTQVDNELKILNAALQAVDSAKTAERIAELEAMIDAAENKLQN